MSLEELLASLPAAYLPENMKTMGLKEEIVGREEVEVQVSSDNKEMKSPHTDENGSAFEVGNMSRPSHRRYIFVLSMADVMCTRESYFFGLEWETE